MISPSRIVGRCKWIILGIGLWFKKSILGFILELVLYGSLKVVLTSLKIPHEVGLLKRCTYWTIYTIMITPTEFTAQQLLLLWSIHLIELSL